MKLSEILKDWPEKKDLKELDNPEYAMHTNREGRIYKNGEINSHNTALTSCDREIEICELGKALFDFQHRFEGRNFFDLDKESQEL
ncbi:MAG TPA: hypothetical protein VIY47_17215, partial [Ignavibacteriaceae bacterium]